MGNSTQGGVLKSLAGLKTGAETSQKEESAGKHLGGLFKGRGMVVGEIQFNGIRHTPSVSSRRLVSYVDVYAYICRGWVYGGGEIQGDEFSKLVRMGKVMPICSEYGWRHA